jgi:hypothetical protein
LVFCHKAQFYLHECGQITLADLTIGPKNNGSSIVDIDEEAIWNLPLADVPMPTNVKNFKGINIRLVCIFL